MAGLKVHAALVKGNAVFRSSRATALDSLPNGISRFRTDMNTAMTDLISASDATVKATGERAATMAARLRLVTDVPQIRSAGPIYLFPSLPTQEISIRGSFPNASTDVPVLNLNGKTYKAFDHQADTLKFSIRSEDFDITEPGETAWKAAELLVPWTNQNASFFNAEETAKFRIIIGMLPHSFGSLVMEKSTAKIHSEEKSFLSESFSFNSDARTANESRCLSLSSREISEGWKLRRGSGSVTLETREFDSRSHEWKDLGMQSESDQRLCWKVRALQVPPWISGDATPRPLATWKISAKIYLERREQTVDRERVDLAWGSKHFFNIPDGTWKLRYTRQGSAARELTGPDTSNPLIRVTGEGPRIEVNVYPY